MGRRFNQPNGGWKEQPGRSGIGVVPLEWRQDWFINLCLAIILAALLFFMMLSIYLVVTKPPPVSIPGGTGAITGGANFVSVISRPDGEDYFPRWGLIIFHSGSFV
jgi:hypothetical protein